jgi:hypothetical protein
MKKMSHRAHREHGGKAKIKMQTAKWQWKMQNENASAENAEEADCGAGWRLDIWSFGRAASTVRQRSVQTCVQPKKYPLWGRRTALLIPGSGCVDGIPLGTPCGGTNPRRADPSYQAYLVSKPAVGNKIVKKVHKCIN